mmetsp:Transcript_4513/g.11636  ORF Transcript_4513/g.11636 Transcript_4513/m.11636 type:complete len:209 (+) Transcript_4513:476-1102(+)
MKNETPCCTAPRRTRAFSGSRLPREQMERVHGSTSLSKPTQKKDDAYRSRRQAPDRVPTPGDMHCRDRSGKTLFSKPSVAWHFIFGELSGGLARKHRLPSRSAATEGARLACRTASHRTAPHRSDPARPVVFVRAVRSFGLVVIPQPKPAAPASGTAGSCCRRRRSCSTGRPPGCSSPSDTIDRSATRPAGAWRRARTGSGRARSRRR